MRTKFRIISLATSANSALVGMAMQLSSIGLWALWGDTLEKSRWIQGSWLISGSAGMAYYQYMLQRTEGARTKDSSASLLFVYAVPFASSLFMLSDGWGYRLTLWGAMAIAIYHAVYEANYRR